MGDEFLYGKNGLVACLLPLQRVYNEIKNRELEYINRISIGVFCVEEGSVDLDELRDDWIYAGKTIVYRQGADVPTLIGGTLNTQPYIDSAKAYRNEMYEMAEQLAKTHITDDYFAKLQLQGAIALK